MGVIKRSVYLFRCPHCSRGWLAYLSPTRHGRFTLLVSVEAENGAKAKNKAITLANKGFPAGEIDILDINFDGGIFSIYKFPELKEMLGIEK